MATSNFSGFDEASNSWFWNGNKTTADRYRYELSRQQETTLKQVNDLITREAAQVVAPAAGFSQQEYGGYLRQVVPTLLDQYGKINATAAIQFYDQSRDYWTRVLSDASQGGRDARRSAATRFATARTRSSLAVAQGYSAQFADTYDTISKTDTVVNFAMKVRAKSGHAPSVEAMNNALTREVASYHRDTVLFNSALDPYVQRVQRVAQATACEFCRLMALGSTTGKVRVSTYAAKFHSHCHCTIQPLFDGEQPIRPDYYDKFEKEYAEASKKGGSAKNILAEWRKNSSAPQVPASQKVLDEKLPKLWPWEKEYKSLDVSKRQPLQELNELRKTIPLANVSQNLKVSEVADTLEDAMVNTNPNYNLLNKGYRTNCARVIQAYELRRRGFNVVANAEVRDMSQTRLYYLSGWKDLETGKTAYEDRLQVPKGVRLVKREEAAKKIILDNHPDGSRGAVSFFYTTGSSGHTMNWERVGDKIIWVDAQPGKSGDEVGKYFGMAKDIDIARLDNKEPMAQVLQYLDESSFE